ncbi:plasmid replication protein RepC [Brucella pseudogrignonensis]|uniref:Replication initiation protein RepC n=1 Tax=Brucella pseudogrignonensis TaxID=419475 RepID=A0ABU1MEA8_9HYPH|nr:plasmid replication protein RepC [Brucella pseudogrignonensis]MDR6434364.1 replication initiation protein RepC [Brucella pseudogrignonensis]
MQILEAVTAALRSRMTQRVSTSEPSGEGIKKWELYRHLCIAKADYSLNDRCLTVLNSLLSFLSDDTITSKSKLVVFPSNKLISQRAHMMPESTLRRHLTSLIAVGIITRKDSPNFKRYAYKSREGEVELAFGFDFSPFFAMASEIKSAADRILDEQRVVKRLRDEISITAREMAKSFTDAAVDGSDSRYMQFRDVVNSIPRKASLNQLKAIKANLEAVFSELAIALKNINNAKEMSGNGAQIERHIESLTEPLLEEKDDFLNVKEMTSEAADQKSDVSKAGTIPLDLVLRACPDISAYSPNGMRNWRDLIDVSKLVSRFLGISQAAYNDAVRIWGIESASAVIASILQKNSEIACAGGYLRSLVGKARAGGFSVSNMIMGSLRSRSYQ